MKQPTIAVITAGAGGMYCGSCLHDNLLVTALRDHGTDAVLIPTYTPIRTDGSDISLDRVFFGGINVFLQEKVGLFRKLPKFVDGWLDHPALIRWITSRKMDTNPRGLGPLTLSMLRGTEGRQHKEVQHLVNWLATQLQPDLIVFSNMLIAGCAPALKQGVGCPILVTLQGDDVFLDGLPEADRIAAIAQMQTNAASVDGFLTHSQFYADHMAEYLALPRDQFHLVPLGIEADDLLALSDARAISTGDDRTPTVGYLARLAPEKGLHVICDAVSRLRERPETGDVRLKVAGWLDPRHEKFADASIQALRNVCGHDAVELVGEVDRAGKVAFFESVDVFSVPAPYKEPKGLYVLEALAAGVPVVQPNHGAFPERLAAGGGVLFEPGNVERLVDGLFDLLQDTSRRKKLALDGPHIIREHHSAEVIARKTMGVYGKFI